MIQLHNDPGSMAVQLNGLTKRFRKTTVVDRISFSIPYGKVFGLIGPNGAGKSTTLKMLMNMLSISDGSASVLGVDVARDFSKISTRVGYVPENHYIYRWMRVHRVIRFASSFYPTWNESICQKMLRLFDLDPSKKVKHLSKGMLAKLALLIAISHEPDLLILDEPLSGLDPIVRDEFLDGVMQSICDRETTVVFSSHTIDDVQRLADSVGLLNDGKLLVNRPLDELLANTMRVRAVLTGEKQPRWTPPSTIYQRLTRREWTLTIEDCSPELISQIKSENDVNDVEVLELNLEDLFKDYVLGSRGTNERTAT